MAIQNALSKRGFGELSKEDKSFLKEILTECDTIALQKEESQQ